MAQNALTNGAILLRSEPNLFLFLFVCPSCVNIGTVWRQHTVINTKCWSCKCRMSSFRRVWQFNPIFIVVVRIKNFVNFVCLLFVVPVLCVLERKMLRTVFKDSRSYLNHLILGHTFCNVYSILIKLTLIKVLQKSMRNNVFRTYKKNKHTKKTQYNII